MIKCDIIKNMNKTLGLNDVINITKTKKVLVSELVNKKGEIFNLLKKGFVFTNEVLEMSGIKKTVRDEKVHNLYIERTKEKEKVYQKDNESLKNILKSLSSLDKQQNIYNNNDEDETEENIEEL